MSHLTEKAIQEAFVKLLNERPLDKITVREIAGECGINRNTFYYHYHDIYDLLETLFVLEEQRIVANVDTIQTLQQSFEESMRFVLVNRQAVYHVFNSVSRDVLTAYLYNARRRRNQHHARRADTRCGGPHRKRHSNARGYSPHGAGEQLQAITRYLGNSASMHKIWALAPNCFFKNR